MISGGIQRWTFLVAILAGAAAFTRAADVAPLESIPGATRRNVIFILSDDHRFDALGFMGHPFLKTPNLDAMAKTGVHCKNAFVTTALCSPSRASILTGQYAHKHGVVDNNNPVPAGTIFFPQYLQKAGYATALFGKWHMGGDSAAPQPGFDRWVSFRGQGTYWPSPAGLNVDGQNVPQKGYITDELTDYALDWLKERKGAGKPFFMYLSHKAVHSNFMPAERHKGKYTDQPFTLPKTFPEMRDDDGRPMWVKNQRNSHHGVEFPYHSRLDIAEYHRRYCETLLAVDESVGRVFAFLKDEGLLENTLVIYMGDNGFAFGEHGLIDKRTAYEWSMRVPMILHCPALFKGGSTLENVVANIDIGPTVLEAAGLVAPAQMQGKSFLQLARGEAVPWRSALLYEYYWERNFPQTPTLFALRGDRFKYIRCHGIWDTDELYDIVSDPEESKNLIRDPQHAATVKQMNRQLFEIMKETGGMDMPLLPDSGGQQNLRRDDGSTAAPFPSYLFKQPKPKAKEN